MAASTKSAPFVTFLTSVMPRSDEAEPSSAAEQESAAASAPPTKASSSDEDVREGARAVILTVLSKEDAPLPEGHLQARSEMNATLYKETMQDLINRQLIIKDAGRYTLSRAGFEEAARERARILNIW